MLGALWGCGHRASRCEEDGLVAAKQTPGRDFTCSEGRNKERKEQVSKK